jgi:hypothetical protein
MCSIAVDVAGSDEHLAGGGIGVNTSAVRVRPAATVLPIQAQIAVETKLSLMQCDLNGIAGSEFIGRIFSRGCLPMPLVFAFSRGFAVDVQPLKCRCLHSDYVKK